MVAGGLTPGQLAEMYDFTPGQVTRIINSPMFVLIVKRIEEKAEEKASDVRGDLKAMADRAVEVLDEQLNRTTIDSGLQQRAAFGVLDRAGYAKKEGPIRSDRHLHLHSEAKGMTDKELRDDVMDMVEGDYEESGKE